MERSRPAPLGTLFGFTLLEVMVAVAILGLSLTVILSAQVGLFSSGTYSQHVGEALGLGRCKMTELEEDFLKLGYPLVDTQDEGACCAGDLRQDMRCAWKIETVELPAPNPMDLDGGAPPAGSSGLDFLSTTASPAGSSGLGALSALAMAGSMPPSGAGRADSRGCSPPEPQEVWARSHRS
jgi:general secretion pathway protein I